MDADLAQGRIRIFQFPDEPAPGLSPPTGEPHRNDAPEGLESRFDAVFHLPFDSHKSVTGPSLTR